MAEAKQALGFNAGDANLRRYVGNSSLNARDPSGELIIFIHGIYNYNTEDAKMLHSEFKTLCGNGGEHHAVINFRYGHSYFGRPYTPDWVPAATGTYSRANHNGARWLARYVKWYRKEQKRLGSNEEIIVIGYSNGSNVIYSAAMNYGADFDRVLFLGGSVDVDCDWKGFVKKSDANVYNFWSNEDDSTWYPDGIGTFPPKAKGITNVEVPGARHTADDAGTKRTATQPTASGDTAWLTAHLAQTEYAKRLGEQEDFKLSKSAQEVYPYFTHGNYTIYNNLTGYGHLRWEVGEPLEFGFSKTDPVGPHSQLPRPSGGPSAPIGESISGNAH